MRPTLLGSMRQEEQVRYPPVWDLDAFMRSLNFERDDRSDLDGRRRSEFRRGWARGSAGEKMTEARLRALTWHNLGFRAGRYFPNASDNQIEAVLDELEVRFLRASGHPG